MARNIQSLERAAAMLRLLAGGERQLGLSDIASSLGLAKGTAHGILRTLQQEGFVEQDTVSGRYQLGAELLRLGTTYLDVHELRARALVWTDDLARSSGESVYLGVLHQQGVLIVHHVFRPDDSRQVLEVGAMQPLHSTALGKVLSAYDPVAHSEVLEVERKAFTPRTISELDDFEGVLGIAGGEDFNAVGTEGAGDEFEAAGMVVDNEDGHFGRTSHWPPIFGLPFADRQVKRGGESTPPGGNADSRAW